MGNKVGMNLDVTEISANGLFNLLDCNLRLVEDLYVRDSINIIEELISRLARNDEWLDNQLKGLNKEYKEE